jgi:hypothetical protein
MSEQVSELAQMRAEIQDIRLRLEKKAFQEISPLAPMVLGDVTLNTSVLRKMVMDISNLGKTAIRIDKGTIHQHKEINPATNRLNSPIVAFVKSSDGITQYPVKANDHYGLSCDCPDWKFRPKDDRPFGRGCKHTLAVEKFISVQ